VFNGTIKTRHYIKWKINIGGTSGRWCTINDITCLIYVIDKNILDMYIHICELISLYIYIYTYIQ
jgi:hypothetical protein